jgi:hypothetical protein
MANASYFASWRLHRTRAAKGAPPRAVKEETLLLPLTLKEAQLLRRLVIQQDRRLGSPCWLLERTLADLIEKSTTSTNV